MRESLDAAGIKVGMFGSPIGKTDLADDLGIELGRLDHLAGLRDVLGCSAVRIFSFYNKKAALGEEHRLQKTLSQLTTLRDRAAELGLMLYHENETGVFGDHPDDVLELAELRDGKAFGLIYDFGNYLRAGVDPWDAWQELKPHTDAFHFKDQKRSGEHVPLGQGDTQAFRILEDAVESGWSGPCTLEPHLHMSEAVLATNVHGRGDTALATHSRAEIFQIGAKVARSLLAEVGAM